MLFTLETKNIRKNVRAFEPETNKHIALELFIRSTMKITILTMIFWCFLELCAATCLMIAQVMPPITQYWEQPGLGPVIYYDMPSVVFVQGDSVYVVAPNNQEYFSGSTYVSGDYGKTWNRYSSSSVHYLYLAGSLYEQVQALTTNNGRLFGISTGNLVSGRLYYTNSSGWQRCNFPIAGTASLSHGPAFSGNVVLAKVETARWNWNPDYAIKPQYVRSLNNGTTWTTLATVGIPETIQSLLGSPTHFYAISGSDIVRSADSGRTWVRFALPDSVGLPLSFIDSTIYASGRSGIVCSADNGRSWSIVGANFLGSLRRGEWRVQRSRGRLYAISGNLVYVLPNERTGEWTQILPNMNEEIKSVQESADGTLFIQLMRESFPSVYISSDGGRTANALAPFPLRSHSIIALAINSANLPQSTIFAGGIQFQDFLCATGVRVQANIFRSQDRGATWEKLPTLTTEKGIVVHDNRIYAARLSNTIGVSNNNGTSWTETLVEGANRNDNITSLVAHSSGVYALAISFWGGSSTNTVVVSTNAGVSWENVQRGLPIIKIQSPQTDPDKLRWLVSGSHSLFAATYNAVYRLNPQTREWMSVLTIPNAQVNPIQTIAANGTKVVIGLNNGAIMRSDDDGTTFTVATPLLTNTQISNTNIAFDGTYLVASASRRVWMSSDFGNTWRSITSGIDDLWIYALEIVNGRVFAATNQGVYRSVPLSTIVSVSNKTPPRPIASVAPNPAHEEVITQFTLNNPASVQISFYNMLGQKVSDFTYDALNTGNHSLHISTSHLPSGSYVWKISLGAQNMGGLFVIQH